MAIPRVINPQDYKNNQQLLPLLGLLLNQAGFDAEDQDVFTTFMFASGNPSESSINNLAQKYHTDAENVHKHAKLLDQQIRKHPFVADLLLKNENPS